MTGPRSGARLIRRWRLRASHHYRRPDLSEQANRDIFGSLADPHEHDWTFEARIVGPIDSVTGWVSDLASIDEAWMDMLAEWDGESLNGLLPSGTPCSTEELARWAYRELASRMPSGGAAGASLESMAVFEDGCLGAEYPVQTVAVAEGGP